MSKNYEEFSLFEMVMPHYKIDPNKKLRLITMFSGYDSQALALKYLGVDFEHYRTCEWAVKSIQALKDLHFANDIKDYSKEYNLDYIYNYLYNKGISSNYNEPMKLEQIKRLGEDRARTIYNNIIATKNMVNIQQVKAEDLQIVEKDKYEYLFTYSFPCVLAGYKVKTKNGYKNIEEIKVEDTVLTHTNTFQKVVKLMKRKKQSYYIIKYLGGEIKLTEEHPLYVLRDKKFQWIKVKDLKLTDRLCININKNNIDVPYDKKMLWLLGRYVADGHYNKYTYNSINFSISFEKEEEFLNSIPENYICKFKKTRKKCWDYRIADKDFKNLCLQFNTGAKNKEIPQWVIDLPNDKLQSFFNGYMSGDGHSRLRNKIEQKMFCTVSEKLFLGLQDIILKLYNKVCSLYIRKDKRKQTFNNCYCGQFAINEDKKYSFVQNDKACVKINKINLVEEEVDVFNFQVENDNSYTVNNIIVHNCQDLSLAGLRKGMKKGESTRSGMLWEVERILDECKELNALPNILFMENVPEVIGKNNIKDFQKWIEKLESLGYSNYVECLNSKDYGIPQNRNRCFMISILGEYVYKFPQPFELKLRLKDLLESNVDEKYYLSDKMIKYITADNEKWTGNNNKSLINKKVASTLNTNEGSRRCDASNYICEELPEEYDLKRIKNKRLKETIEKNREELEHADFLDCYNRNIKKDVAVNEDLYEKYEGMYQYSKSDNFMKGKERFTKNKEIADTILTNPKEGPVISEIPLKRGYSVKVQKEVEDSTEIDVVGNYSKSEYNATQIVGKNGISPTIRENHGEVTAIVERGQVIIPEATKKGYAIAKDGDGIYVNRPHQKRGVVQKGMIPTLTTQVDNDLAVVVKTDTPNLKQQLCNSLIENGLVEENELTCIEELLLAIFDLCSIINTKENGKYERSRSLLQILWREITKEEIWEEIRRFYCVQKEEILQPNVYENGIHENRLPQSRFSDSPCDSKTYNGSNAIREKMFDMWENWKDRYTPQRYELSEQQFRQFNLFMSELSHETTSKKECMQNLWQTNERFRILQQTLFKIQEIWRSNENEICSTLRIRKLSPRETFRLMGVKDEDFDKIKNNQSDSSLWHLAGDSIVTTLMVYMFEKLF